MNMMHATTGTGGSGDTAFCVFGISWFAFVRSFFLSGLSRNWSRFQNGHNILERANVDEELDLVAFVWIM
jgi:hypothetical protein